MDFEILAPLAIFGILFAITIIGYVTASASAMRHRHQRAEWEGDTYDPRDRQQPTSTVADAIMQP